MKRIAFAGIYLTMFLASAAMAQQHDWLIGEWSGIIEGWQSAQSNRYLRIQTVTPDGSAAGTWSTLPNNTGKAVIKVQGNEVTVVTSALSTVALKREGDRLIGTFTLQGGRSYPISMSTGSLPAPASRAVLSKSEAGDLLIGKVLSLKRLRDDAVIVWDIRKDGYLYAQNRTSNSSDSASWEQNNEGGLCLTWRGNTAGGCVYVARQGGSYTLGNRTGTATLAVTEIK